MLEDTNIQTQDSEEAQVKQDDTRFQELKDKTDKTTDETKEFGEIKERYGQRMQKKINQLTWEKKSAVEERDKLATEVNELSTKITEIEVEQKRIPPATATTPQKSVQFENQWFFDNKTLYSMVHGGQMTENEAYEEQRRRDRAEDRDIIRKERETKDTQDTFNKIRKEDGEGILKKYPHFNQKHPDHNPNDTVYKLATQLLEEGLKFNPKGMSIAINRAEQILGIKRDNIDVSEDLTVHATTSASPRVSRETAKVKLEDDEKDAVIRMYRNVINPRSGRLYTEKEALEKAQRAKESRKRRV